MTTQKPPVGLINSLKKIGPGMVLAASIVGSGELIATTVLGAELGFVALWIVIFSCVIKISIQSELGRYTIATSQTGLEAFSKVPPKNIVVWAWAITSFLTLIQIGAMYAGVAQVLNLVIPNISVNVWIFLLFGLTLALLLGGGYNRIEKIAMFKVGFFTLLTITATILLFQQPKFNISQIASGLNFQLPESGLKTVVAVFGIVGVGSGELVMYPYWCVEKGYSKFVGNPENETDENWLNRAKGWIKVMNLDIVFSMIVYTSATIAFYLLGAGVLHSMGMVPSAGDMIKVLSNIYTKTLGEWSLWVFYIGAIATLYGTIFASTAANSRVYADMYRLLNGFEKDDEITKIKIQKRLIVILSIFPIIFYFIFQSPVQMVMAGGIAQAVLLPILGWTSIYLHYFHLPNALKPNRLTTLFLWISTILITVLMSYFVWIKVIG